MTDIVLGSSLFPDFIQKNILFVDKSLLIKEIIQDKSKCILITRPRRWGKSLDLSMLQHFFAAKIAGQHTQGLFDNLDIATVDNGLYMQHQGQYPVIFISFKDVEEKKYSHAIDRIYSLTQRVFNQFSDVLDNPALKDFTKTLFKQILQGEASQQTLKDALLILSECLSIHYGKKVYILIDEYDKPLNAAYQNAYFDDLSQFMKTFLSAGLKDNIYLEKGILTGILRLSKANMLSGLNNLQEYTLLNNTYAHYFGFTENEVADVFQQTGLSHNLEHVKAWYNGYKIGDVVLYNPWSIMSCAKNKGELKAYWVDTADNSLIGNCLINATEEIKYNLKQLLEGKKLEVIIQPHVTFDHLTNDPTALWSLLLFAGYLRLDSISHQNDLGQLVCHISVPNKEVLQLLIGFITRWFAEKSNQFVYKTQYLNDLLDGKVAPFTNTLKNYLTSASFHDTGDKSEMFYHGFVLALVAQLRESHHVLSNRESGSGRYDVAIIPKTPRNGSLAVLLEFKRVANQDDLNKAAQTALAQIALKAYSETLQEHPHVQKILRVGMAFSGKDVLALHDYMTQ